MTKIANFTTNFLPEHKPRYLMGVGYPKDILAAVKCGVDMFDCVLPTRSGRTGLAFSSGGDIKIRNSKYSFDKSLKTKNKELMLHSYKIKFIINDKKHTYKALLPSYFKKLIKTKRLKFLI